MVDQGRCADSPQERALPVIILSGGQSLRMGTDKTQLPFAAGTVLESVERAFMTIARFRVVVAGFGKPAPPVLADTCVIHDAEPGLGPMEGLRAGLLFCRDKGEPAAMVATADAPLIAPKLYCHMARTLLSRQDLACVIPFCQGTVHPLTAVWRTDVVTLIAERIRDRKLRVKDLAGSLPVHTLTETELRVYDPELLSFRNINTPEEYRQLCGDVDEAFHP
jgi:molybdenum cofactor guanylyltransferase